MDRNDIFLQNVQSESRQKSSEGEWEQNLPLKKIAAFFFSIVNIELCRAVKSVIRPLKTVTIISVAEVCFCCPDSTVD